MRYGILFVPLLTLWGCSGEAISWKVALPVGESRTFVITTTEHLTLNPPAGPIQIKSTIEYRIRFEVQSVDAAGTMTMKAQYDRVQRTPEMLMFSAADRGTQGVGFTLRISSEGKALSVDDLEGLHKSVEAAIRADERIPADSMDVIVESQLESLTRDVMVEQMSALFSVIPPHPVAKGDSWTVNDIPNHTHDVFATRTWTVQSVEPDVIRLRYKDTLTPGNFRPDSKSEGQAQGEVTVDRASGLIKRVEGTFNTEGHVVWGAENDVPEGTRVPTTFDSQTLIEVFKL